MNELRVHNLDTGELEITTWKGVIRIANRITQFLENCEDDEFVEWVTSSILNCETMNEDEWVENDE